MKTIRISIPAIPHHDDMIKALVQREELNRKFIPTVVPAMKYPSIKFRPTSLKAFLYQIIP